MLSHSRVRAPALLTSAGLVVLAVVVVFTAVWVVTDQGPLASPVEDEPVEEPAPEPEPAPAPEPAEPEPDPEPEPEPVVGTVHITEVVDLSPTGAGVFQPGSAEEVAVPADDDAIERFADAVGAWLDAYVSNVPAGTWPLVADPAAGAPEVAGLPVGAGDRVVVTSASYALRVGALGVPEWIEALVTLETDGGPLAARFTFADAGAGGGGGAGAGRADDHAGAAAGEDGDAGGVGDAGDDTATQDGSGAGDGGAGQEPTPLLVAIEPLTEVPDAADRADAGDGVAADRADAGGEAVAADAGAAR